MTLSDFLFRYKDRGVVEKDGVKFKKYAKVPWFRKQHKRAVYYVLGVLVLTWLAFTLVRHFAERVPPPVEDAVG